MPAPVPRRRRRQRVACLSFLLALAAPAASHAQAAGAARAESTITVAAGKSRVLVLPSALRRVAIANPAVAEAMVVAPTQVLINGKTVGTTSLVTWDAQGRPTVRSVEVTADAAAIRDQLRALFPGESIQVTPSGKTVVLSGRVSSARVAQQAVAVAKTAGLEPLDQLAAPAAAQVLLQVRLAEVSRTGLRQIGLQFLRNKDGVQAVGATPFSGSLENGTFTGTFSDALNLFLFDPNADIAAFVRALESDGVFRSLAEPNLLALDGKEASFLAGGEFPYPVVQGTGTQPTVNITFKEFGVRLGFQPTVTSDGGIRLRVAPEVSQLDFSNGLQASGFRIPAILARRAQTEVELRDGQTFAIGGLLDNSITDNIDKIPFLGDIPILGRLFQSKDLRERRTELLVLVTPRLVAPSNVAPPVPSGEPGQWPWTGSRRAPGVPPDKNRP